MVFVRLTESMAAKMALTAELLWGAGHVGDCLGEDDLGLGHSYAFYCLGCGDCYAEGLWIGVSDVFGGEDHDSSGYEFDVFSGVEHFCKVVDCCVRV